MSKINNDDKPTGGQSRVHTPWLGDTSMLQSEELQQFLKNVESTRFSTAEEATGLVLDNFTRFRCNVFAFKFHFDLTQELPYTITVNREELYSPEAHERDANLAWEGLGPIGRGETKRIFREYARVKAGLGFTPDGEPDRR
jgi:hypothetical protein